jgi:hypothetical protein
MNMQHKFQEPYWYMTVLLSFCWLCRCFRYYQFLRLASEDDSRTMLSWSWWHCQCIDLFHDSGLDQAGSKQLSSLPPEQLCRRLQKSLSTSLPNPLKLVDQVAWNPLHQTGLHSRRGFGSSGRFRARVWWWWWWGAVKHQLVIINATFDAMKQDLLPFLRGHAAA